LKGLLPWEKKALGAGWIMPKERQQEIEAGAAGKKKGT
jgi:hypothetical protein